MEQVQTNEDKRLQSVNRRLALRSATAIACALLHQGRNLNGTMEAKHYIKELYKFNLKLLTK